MKRFHSRSHGSLGSLSSHYGARNGRHRGLKGISKVGNDPNWQENGSFWVGRGDKWACWRPEGSTVTRLGVV